MKRMWLFFLCCGVSLPSHCMQRGNHNIGKMDISYITNRESCQIKKNTSHEGEQSLSKKRKKRTSEDDQTNMSPITCQKCNKIVALKNATAHATQHLWSGLRVTCAHCSEDLALLSIYSHHKKVHKCTVSDCSSCGNRFTEFRSSIDKQPMKDACFPDLYVLPYSSPR